MPYIEKRNPRFDKRFPITITFNSEYKLKGVTHFPSHYGTSMEVSELTYQHLERNLALWEEKEVKVESYLTTAHILKASINRLFQKDGKFFISLKLAPDLHWYIGNESSIPKYVPVQVD